MNLGEQSTSSHPRLLEDWSSSLPAANQRRDIVNSARKEKAGSDACEDAEQPRITILGAWGPVTPRAAYVRRSAPGGPVGWKFISSTACAGPACLP